MAAARPAVRDVPWVAVDLEMTGLDPEVDRICEIGLVAGSGDGVAWRWSTLVDPGVPVGDHARRLHGLGPEELRGAPTFAEVADEVLARLDHGALLLAHNAAADRTFLERALHDAGRAVPAAAWVDTLAVARGTLLLPRHRLVDVCRSLGVPHERPHRALEDAEATLLVWARMLDVLDPDGTLDVEALLGLLADLAPGSGYRRRQWEVLAEAHAARRSVHLEYLSRDDDGRFRLTRREVQIWKMAPPRVEGWCMLRGERRIFRLERIRRVVPGDVVYDIPEFQAKI